MAGPQPGCISIILLLQAGYSAKIRLISREESRTTANASMHGVKDVRITIDDTGILPYGGCGPMMGSLLRKIQTELGSPIRSKYFLLQDGI
jgi:hypothetical protein